MNFRSSKIVQGAGVVIAAFIFFAVSKFIYSGLDSSEKGNLKRGRQVYQKNCIPCHGENGDGKSRYGPGLGVRDFTKGEFKYGSSDGLLFRTISAGVPPKMPAWKNKLTVQQRRDVTAFVRAFVKKE